MPFPNITPARGTRGHHYSASGSLPGVEHRRVTVSPRRCPRFTASTVSLDFPCYTAGSFSVVLHWVFVAVTIAPASARGILRAVPFRALIRNTIRSLERPRRLFSYHPLGIQLPIIQIYFFRPARSQIQDASDIRDMDSAFVSDGKKDTPSTFNLATLHFLNNTS